MILISYFICGMLYFIYSYAKINDNMQQFLQIMEDEFGGEAEIKNFFIALFLSSLFAWPMMIVNEINNKKGL